MDQNAPQNGPKMDPKTDPKTAPKTDPDPGAKKLVFHWFYNKKAGIHEQGRKAASPCNLRGGHGIPSSANSQPETLSLKLSA